MSSACSLKVSESKLDQNICICPDHLMEADEVTVNSGDLGPVASACDCTSKSPTHRSLHPSLQRAALWPAVVCLKEALLSQWQSGERPSLDVLDGLVGYLARLPGLHLCELESVLTWRYEVGFDLKFTIKSQSNNRFSPIPVLDVIDNVS